MKISDVDEVRQLGEKLEAIKQLHGWLDNWPSQGLKLDSNGLMTRIELPHSTSRSLLDDLKHECMKRLRELGVEP